MKKHPNKNTYGIRRRYLKDVIGLLLLALLLSSICVGIFVAGRVSQNIIDKYEFLNEKMGIALDALYQKSDEVTAECILNRDVQASLKAAGLAEAERSSLSKYFAYVDMDHVAEYIYVDNKEHVYTRSYSKVSYDRFKNSGFERLLGDGYARTTWIWSEDTMFDSKAPALFIGRYVRSMDYAHPPGILYFRMDDEFLDQIIGESQNASEEIMAGVVTDQGELCMSWFAGNYHMDQEKLTRLTAMVDEAPGTQGMILRERQLGNGIVSAYHQEETGFIVFTVIPSRILWAELFRLLGILIGLYVIVMMIAVYLSLYFSKRFTRPITIISEAMTGFNGDDYDRVITLQTNTELDQIGDSYNKMLHNIQNLVEEIKDQEKELRISQMNALISQINPHFLYNTLDTIYMLARINKEETTMKMIQALSKYLRVSLSKGSDMILLKDELDNVRSYMEIQQIRNENLFRYEVDCRVDENRVRIMKLILQPLAENSIKYGFREIYEGGLIQITVRELDGWLVIRLFNNGIPIDQAMADQLNLFNTQELTTVKEVFEEAGNGFGVLNVMTRLRLKYGEQVSLHYEAVADGTVCFIKIPESGWNDEMV